MATFGIRLNGAPQFPPSPPARSFPFAGPLRAFLAALSRQGGQDTGRGAANISGSDVWEENRGRNGRADEFAVPYDKLSKVAGVHVCAPIRSEARTGPPSTRPDKNNAAHTLASASPFGDQAM
jgi:hypothetical protein